VFRAVVRDRLPSSVVEAYFAHQSGGFSRRELVWALLHVLPEFSLLARTRHGWLTYSNKDIAIGRALFLHGEFEYRLIRRAMALLREIDLLRGGLLIDVGANIGTVTLTLLREGFFDRAVAVEPISANYRRLTRNLRLNRLRRRVQPVRAAVGAVTGSVRMALSPINHGDHRLRVTRSRTTERLGELTWPVIEVPSHRLDDIVRPPVGLLWMDVQGHEMRVLEGAPRLLAEGVPVVMEFGPYWVAQAGIGVAEFCAFFAERFEVLYDLGAPTPRAAPAADIAALFTQYQGFRYTDLLALPK
jgi:FkbM family methyltransferase